MKPRKDRKELDHKLVFLAIHQVKTPVEKAVNKLQLYEADLVQPRLPIIGTETEFKGYRFENYDYNGWVYDFAEPGEFVIVLASCPARNADQSGQVDDCNFVFRARTQEHASGQADFDLSSI